jgi:hypothetical protein
MHDRIAGCSIKRDVLAHAEAGLVTRSIASTSPSLHSDRVALATVPILLRIPLRSRPLQENPGYTRRSVE